MVTKERRIAILIFIVVAYLVTSGCASQITTENSVITTVCNVSQKEILKVLGVVVSGMKNHKVIPKYQHEVLVRYDPTNPLMGSATLAVPGLSKQLEYPKMEK